MTQGFVLDLGHYQSKQQQSWVSGVPEKSFWSGLKTSMRDAYHVEAYRCSSCNLVEFYTTDAVDL
jgi:hypothetical protein